MSCATGRALEMRQKIVPKRKIGDPPCQARCHLLAPCWLSFTEGRPVTPTTTLKEISHGSKSASRSADCSAVGGLCIAQRISKAGTGAAGGSHPGGGVVSAY